MTRFLDLLQNLNVLDKVSSRHIQSLALATLLVVGHVSAKEIPVLKYDVSASSAWYPYFIPDTKNPGIVAELVEDILRIAEIPSLPTELPPRRTLFALENGLLDFDVSSPSWFPGNQIPAHFVISNGLIEIREYLVMMPQQQDDYRVVEDIENALVGTVRGYNYQNDGLFQRLDFASEHNLVKALKRGRVEVAIMGDLPAIYWATQTNTNIILGPLNSSGDLHIRLRKEHAWLLPRINEAIALLKQQGKINQLVERYVSNFSPKSSEKLTVFDNLSE